MRPGRFLSENRWPLYLSGLLGMAICAYGVLIYVATRPNAPRPLPRYYETSQRWDADAAVEAASRQLGWTVTYDLPAGVPHVAGTPRPIDVRVVDRNGQGIAGLAGRLLAVRPSDSRMNDAGELFAIPQQPGAYRALVHVDEPGLWELRVDAKQGAVRFVHAARVTIAADAPMAGGGTR
jgi:nitrogen fixation protein FixH